jgi:hypothetical protein
MRSRAFAAIVVSAVAVGWVGRSVFSDEPPKPDPEQEAWAKLAEPGEVHQRLQSLVGDWAVHGKFTFQGQTIESDSTSSFRALWGGRFLEQTVRGTMMGAPFEGRGWMGYDNAKKKLVGVWIDNMGTGMAVSEGDEKEPGKLWESTGTMNGPSGPITMHEVLRKVSDNELVMESTFGKDSMRLEYKRK